MAFVYNNKLPFYSWGLSYGSVGNTHAMYQHKSSTGALLVPLPEDGASRHWEEGPSTVNANSIFNPPAFESTPCDAQMPWRTFAWSRDSTRAVYGLTLHGEVYCAEAFPTSHSGGSSTRSGRRLARVCTDNNSQPFAGIFETAASSSDCTAITKDGKAWHLSRIFGATRKHVLTEIALPSGVQAKYVWSYGNTGSSVRQVVLTTNDDTTYIKELSSSQWYCLTSGVYANTGFTDSDGYTPAWNTGNLPTLTVDAPPAGGVTATVEPVWRNPTDTGYFVLSSLKITNTGKGYTQNPAVTFSVPPDTYHKPFFDDKSTSSFSLQLKVFGKTITKSLFGSPLQSINHFAASDGSTWRFPNPSTQNTEWAVSLASTYTTASSALAVIAIASFASYVLTLSGEMYKLNSSTRKYELFDSGEWVSIAFCWDVVAAVHKNGGLYTWGVNGDTSRQNLFSAVFGDGTEVGVSRATPTRICGSTEWVAVFGTYDGFIAIRKDAICRDIDQPMEYWPDWAYGG